MRDASAQCLRQALALPREREKLLRLEQKLVATTNDGSERLELQPMNSYNRQLVQALAELYGFEFTISDAPSSGAPAASADGGGGGGGGGNAPGQAMGVTLVKTAATAIPKSDLLALAGTNGATGGEAAPAAEPALRGERVMVMQRSKAQVSDSKSEERNLKHSAAEEEARMRQKQGARTGAPMGHASWPGGTHLWRAWALSCPVRAHQLSQLLAADANACLPAVRADG